MFSFISGIVLCVLGYISWPLIRAMGIRKFNTFYDEFVQQVASEILAKNRSASRRNSKVEVAQEI